MFQCQFILGLIFISLINNIIKISIEETWIHDYKHLGYEILHNTSPKVEREDLKNILSKNINKHNLLTTDKKMPSILDSTSILCWSCFLLPMEITRDFKN